MNKFIINKKWKFEEKEKEMIQNPEINPEDSFIYVNLLSEEINILLMNIKIQHEFKLLNFQFFLTNKETIILKHTKRLKFIIIFSYGIIIFWDITKKKKKFI